MSEAISHLIEEHGRRRIAFIRGPEANQEAEERYEGVSASARRASHSHRSADDRAGRFFSERRARRGAALRRAQARWSNRRLGGSGRHHGHRRARRARGAPDRRPFAGRRDGIRRPRGVPLLLAPPHDGAAADSRSGRGRRAPALQPPRGNFGRRARRSFDDDDHPALVRVLFGELVVDARQPRPRHAIELRSRAHPKAPSHDGGAFASGAGIARLPCRGGTTCS